MNQEKMLYKGGPFLILQDLNEKVFWSTSFFLRSPKKILI